MPFGFKTRTFDITKTLIYTYKFAFGKTNATTSGQIAQLVEQRTENPRVGGSNPPLGTISFPNKINPL